MRIVSWNCNGKFSKSIEYLNELNADIYCIQECESPDRVVYDFDGAIFWEGFLSYKGWALLFEKALKPRGLIGSLMEHVTFSRSELPTA